MLIVHCTIDNIYTDRLRLSLGIPTALNRMLHVPPCTLLRLQAVGQCVCAAMVPFEEGHLIMNLDVHLQKPTGVPAVTATDSVAKSLDADMEAERQLAAMVCSINNKDDCLACGA